MKDEEAGIAERRCRSLEEHAERGFGRKWPRDFPSEWLGIESLATPQFAEQDDFTDRDEGGMNVVEMEAWRSFAQEHDEGGERGDAALVNARPLKHRTPPVGRRRWRTKLAYCPYDEALFGMARIQRQ